MYRKKKRVSHTHAQVGWTTSRSGRWRVVLEISTCQRESKVIASARKQTAVPLVTSVNAAVETQARRPCDSLLGSVAWRGSGSIFTLGWLTTAFSFFLSFLWLFSSFNWCFYHDDCKNPALPSGHPYHKVTLWFVCLFIFSHADTSWLHIFYATGKFP